MANGKPKQESFGVHNGYRWMILANPLGFRCGYMQVPEGHPWYGKSYDDLHDVDVHGGLTFSEMVKEGNTLFPGYWIGFDCGHSMDAHDPACADHESDIEVFFLINHGGGKIRTLEYVQAECCKLCDQAHDVIAKDILA